MATANPGFVPFSLRTQSARFKNGGMAIFAAGIVVLFAWLVWQGNLLSSNFLPHVYCYLRNPKLVGLHLVSDALIWLSYVAISVTLIYLERKLRQEMGEYEQVSNVMNHVQLNDPYLDINDPNDFGVITGQFNQPRAMEFGLRFHF